MKFFLAVLAVAPVFAQTQYTIDPAHSGAHFAVRHMTISTVRGDFQKISGTVVFDPKNPSASSVNATIDATSINTGVEARDKDLRSENFFDVAKFPTITFQSTKVEKHGDGYQVTGNLTIHGVTKEAVLDVDAPSAEIKDPRGNIHVGTSATTKINRKDFGIARNSVLDTGGVMIGEEIKITLDIEMTRKAQ